MDGECISIIVEGNPLPKQSFQVAANGGYTPAPVKAWQKAVGILAREAMAGRDPLAGPLTVEIWFYRASRARVDADNLSKAVLDSLNRIVYADDQQVADLYLHKRYDKAAPRCLIQVRPFFDGGSHG